jgi:hypothetical protein
MAEPCWMMPKAKEKGIVREVVGGKTVRVFPHVDRRKSEKLRV